MRICHIKKITALLFILCIFLTGMSVYADEYICEPAYELQRLADIIPDSAKSYVQNVLPDVLDAASDFAKDIGINASDNYELQLNKPYIIYNFREYQDEIYYYPLTANGKIEFILGVIGTDEGYTHQISREGALLNILNEIDYLNNECIFYVIDNELYYEEENKGYDNFESAYICETYHSSGRNELLFLTKSFEEKQRIIKDKINFFKPVNTSDFDLNSLKNTKCGAMKTIKLRNPQSQYVYNMCWACVVATIANTVNMMSYTGFDVCSRMGIGFDKGADIYEMKTALSYYGVDYKIRNGIPYWSEIMKNIDEGYPLAMILFSKYPDLPGHTITLMGYNASNKYIRVYDSQNTYNPDNDSNKDNPYSDGDYYEFYYNNQPRIARNDSVYSWEATLSEY